MAEHLPVLIAGGGIGGLSTAITLARKGIETQVVERSSFTEESGAGIQLGPNATRILKEIGVLDALTPHAFQPEAIWLFDGISGKRLATVPLGTTAEQRYGAPYYTFHRADLHAGLKAVAETHNAISLEPGCTVSSIEPGETVTLRDTDGAQRQGAALVGADGLWSTVRKDLAPDAALSFTGATAFRRLMPLSDVPTPFTAPIVGLWLGPSTHLVHYPVRGGEALNVVAVTETGQKQEGWNQPVDAAPLHAAFAPWCKDSKSLLERAESWRAWSLFSLSGLSRWTQGNITLLGDAVHPVLPYLAQGAGLAIEDAATLARCVAEEPKSPAEAFSAYEAARRPRALRLQQTSHRMGRAYHMTGPLRHARNAVLGLRGPEATLRSFDWLYGTRIPT